MVSIRPQYLEMGWMVVDVRAMVRGLTTKIAFAVRGFAWHEPCCLVWESAGKTIWGQMGAEDVQATPPNAARVEFAQKQEAPFEFSQGKKVG